MSASAPPPSAAASCSTNWNCSSRNSRPQPARTNWRPRPRRGRTARPRVGPRGASRCEVPCRRTCHASGWWFRHLLPAPAVAASSPKLGEDVTETPEVVPRRWKVVQTVRERFACRACESVTQPPAPFHPIARGRAGPELLAMILEAKFRSAPAAQPPERDLCTRGHRARRLHAGRLGRRVHGDAGAVDGADPRARDGGRAAAR